MIVPFVRQGPTAVDRIWGFGSVFAKGFRDSRIGLLATAGLVGFTLIAGGAAMAEAYGTAEARAQMASYAYEIPAAMRGMYGNPVNVGSLGGFVSWHYSGMFALITGLWSVMALSGTMAGDLRRGSLEFVLTSPRSRRSVALQKVGAHVAAMAVAMVVVTVAALAMGALFSRLPQDGVSPGAAAAFSLKMGLCALLAGSLAFALSGFLGARSAAGLAGAVMLGSYVANGWASAIPALKPVAGLTWFSWVQNHLPLAGAYDWPSQLALVVGIAVFLAIGVEVFVRRDVVAASGIALPGLPGAVLGLRGPVSRAFGEMLPAGVAWGGGLAAFAFVIAAASRSFAEGIGAAPDIVRVFEQFFPGDPTSPAWLLQMAFADFGFVLVGLAAATFVGEWASDETSGRLELLLSTPLTRARSAICAGLAASLAMAVTVALLAAALAAGVVIAEGDWRTPTLGVAALAVYGAALGGFGFAVGGLWRPSMAAPAVAVAALATFLVDLLAQPLDLPEWVHELALSAHMGKPMVGVWDAAGLVACLGLIVGGVAVGALGMRRRDVNV